MSKNIVVMASGTGTTFQNLATLSNKGLVNFGITALLTNNSQAKCVNVAVDHNIQTIVVTNDNVWSLIPDNTDLIVLAGWLKLLNIPGKWYGKVLNIHPSLLPKYGGQGFYGIKVHEAVINAEEIKSGCTVHVVDNIYDNGRILGQIDVPVFEFDTPQFLQRRVQVAERKLYPQIIDSYSGDQYHEQEWNREALMGWSGLD